VVISQFDREYLDALIRYNKALVQRNTLLKAELEPDEELMKNEVIGDDADLYYLDCYLSDILGKG
jgi:recombinational DNA repair ATPase RecF